ncbi:MAG: hypothetical protein QW166_04315 [Candidatus Bathyarchaeia archaeon]
MLGHKKLENIETHISLEKELFGDPYNQEFHVKWRQHHKKFNLH